MKTSKLYSKGSFSFIALFYLFILVILFSGNNYAQDEIIKVDTDLITVPVTVFDRNGRYISNLKKEDFQIFEDGVEQTLAFFEPVNKPITVLLLLDTSGSMRRQLNEMASAANAFLSQLKPDDQIIVTTFDNSIEELSKQAMVKDVKQNKKFNLSITPSFRDTMIYDAVDYALKKMKKINGRKAIVLFSDGRGTKYFKSAKGNLRDAEESEALIYTVQSNTYPDSPPPFVDKKMYLKRIKTADKYMSDLAQIAGGRHFQVKDISNLGKVFAQVAAELSQQYRIGYYPKDLGKKGERRQIKVKVNIPNAAVRSRDSYIVGANKN